MQSFYIRFFCLFFALGALSSCGPKVRQECIEQNDSICDLEVKYQNLMEQARILKRRARHTFSKDIITYRRLLRQAAEKEAAAEQICCRIEQLKKINISGS